MAKYFPLSSYLIFTLIIFFSSLQITCSQEFVTSLNRRQLGMKKEKLSHFKFYWHDIYSSPNPTAMPIIQPPPSAKSASTGFGSVTMIDDPITMGPDLRSKLVGRAQGLYGVASQHEVALLMVMNFWFIEGKYNGSSITILGRNRSGLFRFARGYAHASTHNFNLTSGDACVEYNLYVLHY
ncbi:Dirigent protein 19 [Linum perenne]